MAGGSKFLRRIQRLLRDKAWDTDNTFLREPFLQHLPPNVRMALASTPDTGSLNNLAQLADKIMEVATPSPVIAAVSTTSELEHLHKEVAELKSMLQALQSSKQSGAWRSPSPQQQLQELCLYCNKYSNDPQKCKPHVRSRETHRPLAEGDRCSWPLTLLPILHYRHNFQLPFSH